MYLSNTTGDVTTCTFSSNTAANGGALYQNLAQSESSLSFSCDTIVSSTGSSCRAPG